jgi:hypothetical protein
VSHVEVTYETCSECGAASDLDEAGRSLCMDCYEVAVVDEGIVTIEEFTDVQEPGMDPVVGTPGEVLIPKSGNVILYGDGGASKTTLSLDLAFHLAAGDDWLGFSVPRPLRTLVVEAEGPRPMLRDKLRRKLAGWTGSPLEKRLLLLQDPWAEFRFAEAGLIARWIGKHEIDVLIVGPVTAVGFEEHGTIQEVRQFMDQVDDFRRKSGHDFATFLTHHQSKAGKVSGAFEGVCDTLLRAEVRARGKTTLEIEKARWASSWHKTTLKLGWADGEAFEVIEGGERDYTAEVTGLLTQNPWLTAREISAPLAKGGIGANRETVEQVLSENRHLYESRTGEPAKQVGRDPRATVWNVVEDVAQSV